MFFFSCEKFPLQQQHKIYFSFDTEKGAAKTFHDCTARRLNSDCAIEQAGEVKQQETESWVER